MLHFNVKLSESQNLEKFHCFEDASSTVVTSGFSLNSLFSYVNFTTNFALKTMSAVDSIVNRG